jgi:hypothetical protein
MNSTTRRDFLTQAGQAVLAWQLANVAAGAAEGNAGADRSTPMTPRLNDFRLHPIDLREPIRLGVDHIYHGAINRKRGCLPLVRFGLTDKTPWARHEYWGSPHMVGRFLDVLAVSAPILAQPADDEAVEGLRQLLHQCLDNPSGFAFDTFPDPQGRRNAAMHHCREVLLALTGLLRWRGCERSGELARRLVRAIETATRETGTFPAPMLLESGWDSTSTEPNCPNTHSGRLIGALVKYYRVTADPVALDLAVRFADHNIAHTFTPEGDLTPAAGTHLHSTEGTVTALIDLGRLTNEAAYLEQGRRLYDVGLRPWRTSFGWAKEGRDGSPGRGEANNTGDFIEAALLLGQAGYRQYFEDAERFLRNGLLASQIVNTDWIAAPDGTPDTEDHIYSNVRERARGAFAFTTPNEYHSYNTDLAGGAVQSLCEAWEAGITTDQAGEHVNLFFSRDTAALSLRSWLPEEGRLEITLRQARPLFVRLPSWVDRGTVKVQVNGEARPPHFLRHEVSLAPLQRDDHVVLTFPQLRQQTTEAATGYPEPYRIDWVGDTVVGIAPQGQIARLY